MPVKNRQTRVRDVMNDGDRQKVAFLMPYDMWLYNYAVDLFKGRAEISN